MSETLAETWASSRTVLMICLGVSSYVGVLHLTLARRGHAANAWVAVWALATALIQAARFTQLHADHGEDAVAAARVTVVSFPLLVGGLCFVVHSLVGRAVSQRALVLFAGASLALAVVALFTPAFIAGSSLPKLDPFGRPYLGAAAGPCMPLLAVVLAAAVVWMAHTARALAGRERRILWASLAVYLVVGITAVTQTYVSASIPLLAGLGPAAVAIALSHLVVGHERRLARAESERGMQEFAASEARQRELLERAPIGIMSCDATGELRTVNPRMWQIFAASDGVRRLPFGNVLRFESERVAEGVPQLVHTALATGETQAGEVSFSPPWGGPKTLRVTVAPLRAARGRITGALLLCEDDTERSELERRLRLAQKMEAVGQLAAGIAHEINTPMAYVRSNLRTLQEDWSALREEIRKDPAGQPATGLLAEAEELIGESLEGVERTIAIARDMREFAHSAETARVSVELAHELETCVRLASSQRPGVRLTESYAELPPLAASPGQLRQVFLNLIVNALQAVAEGGSVAVSSALEGEFAVVRVRDDGCGIAPELQHRLFEPFFTTKPADQGTGLGLYISYEIVRAYGGEIRVHSAPGAGSTFEVRLPLRQR